MPPISTKLHFGKIFIENISYEIDVPSFILGLIYPETIEEEEFEDIHDLDEDGNIDVREFYEKFNLKNHNLIEKSFIIGYYCYLWFDEYYKFNASRIVLHNNQDLSDEELGYAVNSLLTYYDKKAIDNFYEKYKNLIENFNPLFKLKEISNLNIKEAKIKLKEFFSNVKIENDYTELIEEEEYMNFIKNGCSKIIRSM